MHSLWEHSTASSGLPPFRGDIYSTVAYNARHFRDLEAYVLETYDPDGFEGKVQELWQKPFLCRTVIENFITPEDIKWEIWIESVAARKPLNRIIYIIGAPGQGKTTFAYDTAYETHLRTARPVAFIGQPAVLPPWMEAFNSLDDVPEGYIIVHDESAAIAGTRQVMTREGRSRGGTLATVRHRDQILLIISQNTKLADKDFLVLIDAIVLKPTGLTQEATDAKYVKRLMRAFRELLPRDPDETFIRSKKLPPLKLRREAPEWYTAELSRAYRKITNYKEAMAAATRLRSAGRSWAVVASLMSTRYKMLDQSWWRDHVGGFNDGVDPQTGRRMRRPKEDPPAPEPTPAQ